VYHGEVGLPSAPAGKTGPVIAVLTDTGCDLALGTLQRAGIAAVPLHLEAGARATRENPPAGNSAGLEAEIERHLRVFDGVLAVASPWSEGAQRPRVSHIRSGMIGAPLGELTLLAGQLARDGRGLASTADTVTEVAGAALALYALASAEPLQRFGDSLPLAFRVPSLGATRPIVSLRDSRIDAVSRVRPESAWQAMASALAEHFGRAPVRLAVTVPAGKAAMSDAAREEIRKAGLRVKRGRVYAASAALAAITGDDPLGLCAIPD
jgi:fatty acid-binding protein DegV